MGPEEPITTNYRATEVVVKLLAGGGIELKQARWPRCRISKLEAELDCAGTVATVA